jgi:hypothetical protein
MLRPMTFFTNNWRGLTMFVLGSATVLLALFVFDSCGDTGKMIATASGGQAHMACHWTERAVIGLGGLTAVLGLIMLMFKDAAQGLSLGAFATGALMLATPIWLIPTCKMATMICNLSLKPGALVMAGLIAVAGLVGAIRSKRADGANRAQMSA